MSINYKVVYLNLNKLNTGSVKQCIKHILYFLNIKYI